MKFIVRNKAGRAVRTVDIDIGEVVSLARGETIEPFGERGEPRHEHQYAPWDAERVLYCQTCGHTRAQPAAADRDWPYPRPVARCRRTYTIGAVTHYCNMALWHLGPHQ